MCYGPFLAVFLNYGNSSSMFLWCLTRKLFFKKTGEKMNPEGMCALMDFREDGVTPYMLFFKDGLEEEKVVIILLI